jgi:hypothetical protein
MNRRSVATEVELLLAIRPSAAELDEAISLCETVLAGVVRKAGSWRIDPSLARIGARHNPVRIRREALLGIEVAKIAKAALHAA